MKKILALLFCALLPVIAVQAANIAWVTRHPTDVASGNAAIEGFLFAPDVGYTDLLAANGHTVTRFQDLDNATPSLLASLNTYDLVIVGRAASSSGFYQTSPGEVEAWNGLAVPMMLMNGYVERSSRLGYATTTSVPDTQGTFGLNVNNPLHPIFSGIALDGGNTMLNPYAHQVTAPIPGGTLQSGISVVMAVNGPVGGFTTLAGGGTILATGVGMPGSGANGGAIIAEWAAGSITARGDAFGDARLLFLSGSRENANDSPGIYDLDPDGATMFLNAVNYMSVVPEPATVALLGLGGLALLLRRRK